MSKIETHIVKVTKTTVRYTAEECETAMIAAAVVEAGLDAGRAGLSTHVSTMGDEMIVELMVEEIEGEEPEPEIGPRPAFR